MANAKHRNNLCCDNAVTIGRLKCYMSQRQFRVLADRHGLTLKKGDVPTERHADKFLTTFLDTKSVTSMDCSDYERCDIKHDMNRPIPREYFNRFDALIDGGTLEHIFNVPVAVANYMNMVKQGGSIFIWTMANNHLGHGFYQFSPELFYSIFNSVNGFAINEMVLVQHPFPGAELSNKATTYSVADPAKLKRRVGLVSRSPISIMIHAVRTSTVPIFRTYPIQSDYVVAHARHHQTTNNPYRTSVPSTRHIVTSMIRRAMPFWCQRYLSGKHQLWSNSFYNRQFYKKWAPRQ